ncbi:MAG: glucose-1-phosphate adenylyltransferase [Elusimicrobia bacterium]|nr:glucose-1-phosphate adenylyltransferase [Elusimicrobiota bacterium]
MIRLDKVLVVLLAGGKGERLEPLTRDRAKPAVPFGGMYRIVDMTLSNCINSGLRKILVLTQYMSRSLDAHLREAWRFISRPHLGEFIDPLPPQQRTGEEWYTGTAAAIHQNKTSIQHANPDVLLSLSGDQIYKMDYRHMIEMLFDNNADMVISAIEMPRDQSRFFGIFEVDSENRIVNFKEKPAPEDAPTIRERPDMCLASMGIYAFRPKPLFEALEEDAADKASSHDIGRDIVGRMMARGKVMAAPFIDENKKAFKYWRDVGNIEAYWEAHMDLVAVDPLFNLYDTDWPIYMKPMQTPPPKFVFSQEGPGGRMGVALDSLICNGSIISGGRVRNSVIGPLVRVNSYAEVRESILFDGVEVGRHARVQRAIIDKFVRVPEGMSIGYDIEEDRKKFFVSPSGIVVIPKRTVLT